MPLTLKEAGFLGLAIESIAYGFYIAIFSLSLAILYSRRLWDPKASQVLTVVVVCFLFALSTVYLAVDIANAFPYPDSPADGEEKLGRTTDVLFSIITFFSEVVLIYRCWVIWAHDYRIIAFPALLSLTALTCGVAGIGIIASPNPSAVIPLGTSSFVLSLCVNVITTTLIILRIWTISRTICVVPSISITDNRVQRAMEIMIESGLALLIIQLVFVTLFATNNAGQLITVSLLSQVYGLAPTLIIVRVGMGKTADQDSMTKDQFTPLSHRPSVVTEGRKSWNTFPWSRAVSIA